jgi:hypothetical protein
MNNEFKEFREIVDNRNGSIIAHGCMMMMIMIIIIIILIISALIVTVLRIWEHNYALKISIYLPIFLFISRCKIFT